MGDQLQFQACQKDVKIYQKPLGRLHLYENSTEFHLTHVIIH